MNACVSCTASLPTLASFIDGASKRCAPDSADNGDEHEKDNSGLSFDSCDPDNEVGCADGYVCAKYPVLSNAKYSHCTTDGSCLTVNPMSFFQRCMDATLEHCVCRRIHSGKLTNSLKCSTSSACPRNQRCMQKLGEKIPTTVCHSCTAPAPAAKYAAVDNGLTQCDKKNDKKPPTDSKPNETKPNETKPDTAKPNPTKPETEDDPKPMTKEPTTPDGTTTDVSDTSNQSAELTAAATAESSPGIDGEEGDDETGGSAAPCIAVSALYEFTAHQLVFSEHIRAGVLCDKWGSCATPGHIVVFQNKAMMMRTYCSTVTGGCARRVMLVNSPRIALGLKVKADSPDFHYTALSARYETPLEEFVLSAIIRGGV